METQKSHIHELEQTLIHTKKVYKESMVNLSNISEEVLLRLFRNYSALFEVTFILREMT